MNAKAKRADGRYQVTVSIGIDPETGKRKQKCFFGQTQKEAKAKRDEWLKHNVENSTQSMVSGVFTISGWADKWLRIYGQGNYSVRTTNALIVKKLKKAIGLRRLDEVKKSDIQLIANAVKDRSFSLTKKMSGTINRIFADAVSDGLISANPCAGVAWTYATKGTHRALEPWERDLIRNNWKEYRRVGTWAMIMLYAGLRRGEALALQWKDIGDEVIHVTKAIHFEGNVAVLGTTTKTLAGVRDIPILEPLREVLSRDGQSDEDFICLSADSKPITETAFKRGWTCWNNTMTNILNGEKGFRPGRRSDLPKTDEDGNEIEQKVFRCRTHDLRHTFCTMLFEADVDLKTAQYLMGHADVTMTMKIYTHLSALKQKSSYAKLAAYVKKNLESNACQVACQNPSKSQ